MRDNDPRILLNAVVVSAMVRRPLTQEELDELPAHPPSIRERAKRNGILEEREVGRSDGVAALSVPQGAKVRFEVQFTAQATDALGIVSSVLRVNGSAWDPLEIPVVLTITDRKSHPHADPSQVRLAIEPGTTEEFSVVVSGVAEDAEMVVFVDGGGTIARLKTCVVFRPVRKHFTEEELLEFPAVPASIRENARRNGYIEYQEVARGDGRTPLAVERGSKIRAYLEAAAPAVRAPDGVSAMLVFEATRWLPVRVPVSVIIGKVDVALGVSALSIRQGDSESLQVTLTSVAGPSTDVVFELPLDPAMWTVTPAAVSVPRGQTVSLRIQIQMAPAAMVGEYRAGLSAYSFDHLMKKEIAFVLTVRPGEVLAHLVQPSMTARQGDQLDCQVAVTCKGGPVTMSISAAGAPPGVTIGSVIEGYSPGQSAISRLPISVARDATPIVNASIVISWSADDNEHRGILMLFFTTVLVPDSMTFRQTITTPSGTALGGNLEFTVNNDGSFLVKGHMHDSGFPSYNFVVQAGIFTASRAAVHFYQKSGNVEGTESQVLNPLHSPRRDFDWTETGWNDLIAKNWLEVKAGAMQLSRSFEIGGALGGLAHLLRDFADFLLANVLLSTTPGGQAILGFVFLGSELGAMTGVHFADPGLIPGLVVAGATGCLFAPGLAIVVLLSDTLVQTRKMNDAEKTFAAGVFGRTLPVDRILLTNLSGKGTVEFTVPHVDGSILVNLGIGFANPLTHVDPPRGYATPGQILIHELTHAWQIQHANFKTELYWDALRGSLAGSNAYNYGAPTAPWSSYLLEAQAAIVDNWFAGSTVNAPAGTPGRQPQSINDAYFRYIVNNIRAGVA